jgi:murein DD-endopeptidase MepM/ murein hydrolase activator NlpD
VLSLSNSAECTVFEVIRNVNVRADTSKFSEKVGRLKKGQKYHQEQTRGRWTGFQFNGTPELEFAYTNRYLKPSEGNCFITGNRQNNNDYIDIWLWDTQHNEPLVVGRAPSGIILINNQIVGDFVETFYDGKTRYIKREDIIDLSINNGDEILLEDLDMDAGLYQCALDHGYIYSSEVEELNCSNRSITSVNGIEHLSNLSKLDISNNLFTSDESLLEIQYLPLLSHLDISNNNINTINLNNNKKLKYLSVQNTGITKIKHNSEYYVDTSIYQKSFVGKYNYDYEMIWPLCGRIDNSDTVASQCPKHRVGPSYTDWPFAYGFGPRIVPAHRNRYDFHRGVDIATPEGTAIYAVTDGIVKIAGKHKNFMDNLILIRHTRPGTDTCKYQGCYHSLYMHLSKWMVNEGEKVKKGQLIGYTGTSIAGMWPHLHFEIRNSHTDDPYSFWQRDAINPLNILPLPNKQDSSLEVNVDDINSKKVSVNYKTQRWDVNRIEVRIYDKDHVLLIDNERGVPVRGNYFVNPPFIDFNVFNRTYTHKNSSKFPWEEFGESGNLACPFHHHHTDKYQAGIHMDRTTPSNNKIGMFNGIELIPMARAVSDMFDVKLNFNEINNLNQAKCVEVVASSNRPLKDRGYWGDCTFLTEK